MFTCHLVDVVTSRVLFLWYEACCCHVDCFFCFIRHVCYVWRLLPPEGAVRWRQTALTLMTSWWPHDLTAIDEDDKLVKRACAHTHTHERDSSAYRCTDVQEWRDLWPVIVIVTCPEWRSSERCHNVTHLMPCHKLLFVLLWWSTCNFSTACGKMLFPLTTFDLGRGLKSNSPDERSSPTPKLTVAGSMPRQAQTGLLFEKN